MQNLIFYYLDYLKSIPDYKTRTPQTSYWRMLGVSVIATIIYYVFGQMFGYVPLLGGLFGLIFKLCLFINALAYVSLIYRRLNDADYELGAKVMVTAICCLLPPVCIGIGFLPTHDETD